MTTTVFAIIALVFGAGLALGWVLRDVHQPARREPLPHVELKTKVAPPRERVLPVAPSKPIWEEDPFFARPETLGEPREDDIEHSAGVVVPMVRPLAAARSMG